MGWRPVVDADGPSAEALAKAESLLEYVFPALNEPGRQSQTDNQDKTESDDTDRHRWQHLVRL